MTGTKDSIYLRESLSDKQIKYIKERMRTEERADPSEIAEKLGVKALDVRRLISTLRYIEKMANRTPKGDRGSKGNT